MQLRLRLVLTAAALGVGGVACASIAGLDHSDLPAANLVGDSGTVIADGSVTTDQGITISPTQLPFTSNCGETKTGVVNIINNGAVDRPYEIDLPAGDTFALADTSDGGAPATGTVKAHDAVAITFQARSDAPGPHTVDVIVKAGDSVQVVNLSATVSGATLAIDPQVANFGQVRQQQTSDPITAVFTNTGNAPVTIASFGGLDPTQFQISPATIVVEGGKTTSAMITMLGAAADSSQISEILTPQLGAGSTLCAQSAPQLTLQGQRVSTDVIVGPLTADFGANDCNTTPSATKVITLTNYDQQNPVPYTFTLDAAASAAFKVADSGNQVIPKAASSSSPSKTTLTISANNTGANPGPINGTLSITVNPNGKPPITYPVPVTMNVTGAVLNWLTPKLTFNQNNQRLSAQLQNTGNQTACVFITTTDSHISSSSFFSTIDPGKTANESITFSPHYCDTDYNATIGVQPCFGSDVPICNPSPTFPATGRVKCGP